MNEAVARCVDARVDVVDVLPLFFGIRRVRINSLRLRRLGETVGVGVHILYREKIFLNSFPEEF